MHRTMNGIAFLLLLALLAIQSVKPIRAQADEPYLRVWINKPVNGASITSQPETDFEVGVAANTSVLLRIQLHEVASGSLIATNEFPVGGSGRFCVWSTNGVQNEDLTCPVMLTTTWDQLPRAGEAYTVTVRAERAEISSTAIVTFTVIAPRPRLTWTPEQVNAQEGTDKMATITLTRDGDLTSTFTMTLSIDGPALDTGQVQLPEGLTRGVNTIQFDPDERAKVWQMPVMDDDLCQETTWVAFFLYSDPAITLQGRENAVVMIFDDDCTHLVYIPLFIRSK